MVGIVLFEFKILLKFSERQYGREQEENHPAEHENDDAVGQFAASARCAMKEQEQGVGTKSEAAD